MFIYIFTHVFISMLNELCVVRYKIYVQNFNENKFKKGKKKERK